MSVTSIKLLCWLSSASLTFGLGAYAYDFFQHLPEKRRPVDRDHVREVLDRELQVNADVREGLAYRQVKPVFIDMNWTGAEPPKPVEKDDHDPEPTGPTYRPIAEVLRVSLIQLDNTDAGGSVAYVRILGPPGEEAVLKVGTTLPPPNDFAVVHAIRPEGVEFSFKEEGRPNETVTPATLDEPLIFKADPDTARVKPPAIPKPAQRVSRRPGQTQRLGEGTYRLGVEDMEYFDQNYAEILTNDVSTRTHYDENGRRAGIEIQRVRQGSIASRHGAQDGDIIISINDHPVTSEQEAIKFVKNNKDKYKVWTVVVERLGKRETIVYTSQED